MFWNCFHDNTKDSGLFWKKDWNTIKEENYRTRILFIINDWIRIKKDEIEDLIFIQDSVSIYVTKNIIQDLEERDIVYINWSSYSPNLNPIKNVWNWMMKLNEGLNPRTLWWSSLRVWWTARGHNSCLECCTNRISVWTVRINVNTMSDSY